MSLLTIKRRRGECPEQVVLRVDIDRETDQRWIVDVIDLPGVMAYGRSKREAINKAAALALRVIADRLKHGEGLPNVDHAAAPTSIADEPE